MNSKAWILKQLCAFYEFVALQASLPKTGCYLPSFVCPLQPARLCNEKAKYTINIIMHETVRRKGVDDVAAGYSDDEFL